VSHATAVGNSWQRAVSHGQWLAGMEGGSCALLRIEKQKHIDMFFISGVGKNHYLKYKKLNRYGYLSNHGMY